MIYPVDSVIHVLNNWDQDKNSYEYEIWRNIFSSIDNLELASLYFFFAQKNSIVVFTEGA